MKDRELLIVFVTCGLMGMLWLASLGYILGAI